MRISRRIATPGAAQFMAAVGIASATPASAADLGSTTFGCSSGNDGITVKGQVGDTYPAQSTATSDCSVTTSAAGVVSWVTDDPFGGTDGPDPDYFFRSVNFPATPVIGTTVTFTLAADGSTTWVAEQNGIGIGIGIHFVVGDAGASTPIPAWVQAYARSGQDATYQDGWDASWQTSTPGTSSSGPTALGRTARSSASTAPCRPSGPTGSNHHGIGGNPPISRIPS
jgi:hypothetical protein